MSGFNLFVTGDNYQKNRVSLFSSGKDFSSNSMILYHSGQTPPEYDMDLYISGDNVTYTSMALHTITGKLFSNSENPYDPSDPDSTYDPQDIYDKSCFLFTLSSENVIEEDQVPYLNLYIQKGLGSGIYIDNFMNMRMEVSDVQLSQSSLNISLYNISFNQIFDATSTSSLFVSGFVEDTPVAEGVNLYLENYIPSDLISDSIPLFLANDYLIKWDSEYPGVNIVPDDEPYTSVPANDAIRGVELICYGNCENGTCEDVSLETHDTVWFEPICVDGGIFRASDVYTNPEEGAFGTEVPYSGHFYGMRKIENLIPLQKYYINIIGQAGSSIKIPAPKELEIWEYTVDGTDIGYSGLKLIGDEPYVENGRNPGDKYGSSLSMNGDLLAVGSPYMSIDDSENYTLQDAGSVFLYRRGPEPNFDSIENNKADWDFEAQLSLPSGILRDYYFDEPSQQADGIDIILRKWQLGQEGRNFGKNLHICSIDNSDPWIQKEKREIIAVSAPNAHWSRTFPDLQIQNNEIVLFVFTDEFLPTFTIRNSDRSVTILTYRDVLDSIISKNLLYTYYSNPTISLSIKVVIFHPVDLDIQPSPEFPEPKPSFIVKKPITRHREDIPGTPDFEAVDDQLFTQIKNAFDELYPYDTSKQHNNIPAILGVYVDNSRSLGSAAIEPALTRFKEYYQEYCFNSGVVDVFGNPSSGAILNTTSNDENWILQSKTLIDFTLESGRLYNQDYLQLLTDPDSFGEFNINLPEFNIPPSSGGCVYLFEKESGTWDLIQEIHSPTLDNSIPPDLFGSSISMSEDGSILAIGSPYINEALVVYERDELEQDRMYSNFENWIDFNLSNNQEDEYFNNLKSNIQSLQSAETFDDGHSGIYRHLFLSFSDQEKYNYKNDKSFWIDHLGESLIEEYKPNFTYRYTDIDYKGTYLPIVEEFAPTSRMGYSVAVSDSGNSVAFGCPTDSLDEFDDTNTYYHPDNSGQVLWPSYVNAGCVRVLDSVKYFKHDSIVEYTKFGNRDRVLYEEDYPYAFNHFDSVFSEIGKTFTRTDFDEFDIPDNAGVLFIICPEVDFTNIEVMNRIKRWLNLGDRNLVLVGNDANFEKDGRYRKCNSILNTILEKLDSSMRLVSVNDSSRAILGVNNTCPTKPNIIPSFIPDGSIDSYIEYETPIFGNGAADIRIYAPDVNEYYSCSEDYILNNDFCSPPLANYGDLRTQWNEDGDVLNWPKVFSNRFSKQPPVPLMVAAYYKEDLLIDIPAIPPTSGLFQFYDTVQTDVSPIFGDLVDGEIKFGWSSELQLYNSLNTNVALNSNSNRFFNPPYKMGLDPVLQSKASNGVDIVQGTEEVSEFCHFAAMENIQASKNQMFLIGSLDAESVDVLYSGLGDKSINFYFNIVAKNRAGSSYIAQLNSWSGRSDFTDAKSDSILSLIFRNTGNFVSTNVELNQLISGHPNGTRYDVCWIANPLNTPSDEEIRLLKRWLRQDNKKIVVTYDNDISAKSAEFLCEALGVSISPLYLPNKSRFADSRNDITPDDRNFYQLRRDTSPEYKYPVINPLNSRIRYGFDPERDSIQRIALDVFVNTFIPVNVNNGLSIAYLDHGISDDKFIDVGFYYMKTGTTKISFPVQSNTAYRLFFNTAAYSFYEKEPLTVYITDCNELPSFTSPFVPPSQDIFNLNSDDTLSSVFNGPVGVIREIGGRSQNSLLQENIIDIQTLQGATEISVFISGNRSKISFNYNKAPSTVALVSVSGALVNIDEAPVFGKIPRYEWVITDEGSEARTEVLEFPDPFPIQSNSQQYCPGNVDFFRLDDCSDIFGNSVIDDGPVVVAQEIYQTDITNQGINKSRITVISDASLIEGPCIFQGGKIREESAAFIKSLYPDTEFPENKNSKLFRSTEITKIVSPERSSPARLFSNIGNSGLVEKFVSHDGSAFSSGLALSSFNETVDYGAVLRPIFIPSDSAEIYQSFKDSQLYYGSNSKINQYIDGVLFSDNNIFGGKPSVIDLYGGDFIDSDFFASGYPGDLFGYSLAYHRGKLVVGSPFSAYSSDAPISWSGVVSESSPYETPFGMVVSRNGGAGSVYIYEKTGEGITLSGDNRPWEFKQKLRPKSINVGQDLDSTIDSKLTEFLGENNYSLDDLLKYSTFTDQFGHSVAIYSDIIAVGAPGHDYSIRPDENSVLVSGAFEFKSYNFEFDAKPRSLIDLGDPDIRNAIGLISGIMNNGAVYTFENKIVDSKTKRRSWTMVEKLIPDGYKSRLQKNYDEILEITASGTENEHFGENIALYSPKRSDADYTIAIGTPHHKFPTSGNHVTGEMEDAGAAFLFDAMLREQPPYLPDENCFIEANVFGTPERKVPIRIDNSSLNSMSYTNGFVYSNTEGEIFVEASGQDGNLQGFAIHRPFIKAVYGRIAEESSVNSSNSFNFYTKSVSGVNTGDMPLYCVTPNNANVYTSMVLYVDAFGQSGDGNEITLYAHCTSGSTIDEYIGIYTSGTEVIDTNVYLYSSGY